MKPIPSPPRADDAIDAIDSDYFDLDTDLSPAPRGGRFGPAGTDETHARVGRVATSPQADATRRTKASSDRAAPSSSVSGQTPKPWGRGLTLLAVAIEGVLLAFFVQRLSWGDARAFTAPFMGYLMAGHALAAAVALMGWRALRSAWHPGTPDVTAASAAWQLLALATAALGPLGALGGTMSALLKRWYDAHDASQDAAWLKAMHGEGDEAPLAPGTAWTMDLPPLARGAQSARISRASVSPFDDVMARGTPSQKRQIIEAIVAHYQPSFARTLRRGMRDQDPTVRMLAAAAASRLENQFLDAAMALELDWANHARDSKRALALARHYDEFASSGLLEDVRSQETRERALEMYQLAASERPGDRAIALAVIRLLLKLKREDEAIGLFRPLMEADKAPPSMVSWYLECLYKRRRFGELRRYSARLCSRQRELDALHERSVQAAHWWARDAAHHADANPVDLNDWIDETPGAPPGGEPEAPVEEKLSRSERSRRARHAQVINVPYFPPRWAKGQ